MDHDAGDSKAKSRYPIAICSKAAATQPALLSIVSQQGTHSQVGSVSGPRSITPSTERANDTIQIYGSKPRGHIRHGRLTLIQRLSETYLREYNLVGVSQLQHQLSWKYIVLEILSRYPAITHHWPLTFSYTNCAGL